jgi:DUF1680 family protein
MLTWGQQPRGIFGADERIRAGCTDPRQAVETCGIVELAKSFQLLGRLTGDALYADRCEDIMLNHFPASQTPDLKSLHYLTASNQPKLDDTMDHEYHNKGRQIIYSPHIYRCCQHNVAMGWPWYVQNLWQATADNGIAAWLYASSQARAKVGPAGREVVVTSETGYPFGGRVDLSVSASSVSFPLYLRIPGWCRRVGLTLNGESSSVKTVPSGSRTGRYLRISRQWGQADRISLELAMDIALKRWPRNGSVSVDRGPLSYSVKIGEKWRRCGGTSEWPEWEVLPTTPWNYGLLINAKTPGGDLRVTKEGDVPPQPWTLDGAPLEIAAKAKRIAGWKLENETAPELPESPVDVDGPEEQITLIPLGCARLRMACLPVISEVKKSRAAGKPRGFQET